RTDLAGRRRRPAARNSRPAVTRSRLRALTCIAPTDVRALRRDGGDVAERGDDESAGYNPPDPVVAFHEEAQRVAERLEELVNARRVETRASPRDSSPVSPARATSGPVPVVPVAPVAPVTTVTGARHSGRLLGNLLVDRG